MHNFFWLNLIDRKADHKKLKKNYLYLDVKKFKI